MKIVVLDGYSTNPGDISWAALEALGELTVYPRTAPEEVVARAGEAEAVFLNKAPLTRAVLAQLPRLRFVGIMATGYDVVDLEAARDRGVTVCNVPGYSTGSVAQLAAAFLLEASFRLGEHNRAVHAGEWSAGPDFCLRKTPLLELEGKTLGILGCGAIGRRLGEIAGALGMEVLGYSRRAAPGTREGNITIVGREELLERSRFLSLHCPLNRDSAGFLCRETIYRLPRGAVVINTARGGLAVPEDVAAALEDGQLALYCADVAAVEPISPADPLLKAPNCILTPHIGWATREARERLLAACAGNLRAFLDGNPVNVVH